MATLIQPNELMYTLFEPKTMNRFIMYVDGIPSFLMYKCDRPKISATRQTIDHINIQSYYRGKSIWQEIACELYDPIVPSGAQLVMNWIRLAHESATGRDGYQTEYQKNIVINMLDPNGAKVEQWTLYNTFPSAETSFGTLDWTDEGKLVPIALNLSYNYAVLEF